MSVQDLNPCPFCGVNTILHQRDQALERYELAMHRVAQLEDESGRLARWLLLIAGEDSPCTNAWKLREWARKALAGERAPGPCQGGAA